MKVILFFLLLIGSFICLGQHSANYRTWTIGDGKNFSIKEYETPYTISLYTERNDVYSVFVLTNHDTKISLHIQTPEKLVVNDFWISHDSVFFCGYTTNRSQKFGIIGFFDIDDLFYHHGSFFYQDLFYAKNNVPIVEFTRMVTYLSGNPYQYEYGNRYIACIGSDSLDRACIVEMYRHPELEWGYTSGTNDNLNSETLKDITLVGHHIVTSGFWGGMRALCLRVYDYPGIFNSGIEDMAYLFVSPYSRTWQDDDVRLATVSVDSFATASIWICKDCEFLKQPTIILVSKFHLTNNSGNVYPEITRSVELLNANYYRAKSINSFLYNRRDKQFALPHYANSVSDTASLFYEFSNNLTNIRGIHFYDNVFHRDMYVEGLSGYNLRSRYVFNGNDQWYGNRLSYFFETPLEESFCFPDSRAKVNEIDFFGDKIIPEEYIDQGGFTEIKQVQAIYPYDYELQTECEQE